MEIQQWSELRSCTDTELKLKSCRAFLDNATAAQKILEWGNKLAAAPPGAQKQEQDGVFPIPVLVSFGNLRQSRSSPRVTLN